MRITKTQIATTLRALTAAGDQGVHSVKLHLLTQHRKPFKIIEKLEQQGYVFKYIHMVKSGDRLGTVYILLEYKPRKYFTYEFEDNIAKPVELNTQKELFT